MKRKLKKPVVIVLVLLLLLLLGIGGYFGYNTFIKDNVVGETPQVNNEEEKKEEEIPVPPKKVQIVDTESNKRVYAVMINNNHAAWPQSGLKSAFLIYEIMVEGGISRMMALYTMDAEEAKIGSIRSSRHNYLDYVLENDAIYIHWGGSDLAYADLGKLGINRIDGMVYGGTYFTTDKTLKRSLEHTRFSSTDLIKKGIEKMNFRTTTNSGYLLNYTAEDVDLSSKQDAVKADEVKIKYSNYQNATYKYDAEKQVYLRYMSDKPHSDLVTGEQYTFKNIITYQIPYKTLSDGKLQDLQNIGSGKGYYITNGYSVPITWSKTARNAKTVYKHMDGTEIDVSDGNTFIQIVPNSGSIKINQTEGTSEN